MFDFFEHDDVVDGHIMPGTYWVTIESDERWPVIPAGVIKKKSETQPSTGRSYALLEVRAPIDSSHWPYERWGKANAVFSPYDEALEEEGSTIREQLIDAGDTLLDNVDEAKEVVKKAANSLSGLLWAGAAVGAVVLGLRFKK